jgi:hypothetical protein
MNRGLAKWLKQERACLQAWGPEFKHQYCKQTNKQN